VIVSICEISFLFLFSEMITNIVRPLLDEIFYLGSRSPILAFKKIGLLLQQYNTSDKQNKIAILEHIAKVYHPEEEKVRLQVGDLISKINRLDGIFVIIDSKSDIVEFS
jgi:ABC-type multidrug transport system ATPase subunit